MGAVKKIHEIIILLKLSFEKRKLRQNQKLNIGGLFIFLHRFCSGSVSYTHLYHEQRFINNTDVGGLYQNQWIMSNDRWVTVVYAKVEAQTLPRTGY